MSLVVKDATGLELTTTKADAVTAIDAALVLVRTDFAGPDDSTIQLPWTSYSATSAAVWQLDTFDGQQGAFMNGFGTDDASDDWLISPPFAVAANEIAVLNLDFYTFFSGGSFEILVSNDYSPATDEDPESATWTAADADVTGSGWAPLTGIELPAVRGDSVYLAFRYTSTGTAANESRRIGIDDIEVLRETRAIDTYSFAEWKVANGYFEPGDPDGALTADPDGDGLNNAIEYRFNLNPLQSGGFENLPALKVDGADLSLAYTRIADGDTIWTTQYSSNLFDWTEAVEDTHVKTTIVESGQPGDFLQTVTVTLLGGTRQSPLYWRVVIPDAQ
ncbi:MAG: choice-of-anchor J domain-containing protein [Verrucomicrobiae bacterium]|nr:choice-of-anchor J domain-containing protein [Verrucomicrobiae bacterium]